MIFDEDVRRYAEFIAGHPEATTERHLEAARAVLVALANDGRLLPAGGETKVEYGADVSLWRGSYRGMAIVGGDEFARKYSTHQRLSTVWPTEGPNNDWARYVTAWVEKP